MASCNECSLTLPNGLVFNDDTNYIPNMNPSQTFVKGGKTFMIKNIVNEVTKYYIVDDVTDYPDVSSVTDNSKASYFRACYIDEGLAAISRERAALERIGRPVTGGKTKRNQKYRKHRKSRKHIRTSSRK
jgi:hypothetical protein